MSPDTSRSGYQYGERSYGHGDAGSSAVLVPCGDQSEVEQSHVEVLVAVQDVGEVARG